MTEKAKSYLVGVRLSEMQDFCVEKTLTGMLNLPDCHAGLLIWNQLILNIHKFLDSLILNYIKPLSVSSADSEISEYISIRFAWLSYLP